MTTDVWSLDPPKERKSFICRMTNGYIKMCYWTGTAWRDMWKSTLEGEVLEWMHIPYNRNPYLKKQ